MKIQNSAGLFEPNTQVTGQSKIDLQYIYSEQSKAEAGLYNC